MRQNVFDTPQQEAVSSEDNVFAQFLQTKGLYDHIEITEKNISELCDLIGGKVKLNLYCKICEETRVFSMQATTFLFPVDDDKKEIRSLAKELMWNQRFQTMKDTPRPGENQEVREWYWSNWQTQDATRVMVFPFVCAMDDTHHIDYIVRTEGNTMWKIGQSPSVADLTFPELDAYRKITTERDRKELRRAIGLFASGIGVGSYVYLRRIFEHLLIQAKTNAGSAINDEEFDKARVNEKITMLKDHLPSMLTSNPTLYGILSKGIHELSEDDCIEYFPVVKDCIFMILDEWEEMRKKAEKEKSISASLSKIAAKIK